MKHRTLKHLSMLLWASLALPLQAEDFMEEDFDLDLQFKSRSTLNSFPLQEIDGAALSDTAIEGALQTTSAGRSDVEGKPAYQEQEEKEARQKDKALVVELDHEANKMKELINTSVPEAPPPAIKMDAFQLPNGRVYDHHQTWTVERP